MLIDIDNGFAQTSSNNHLHHQPLPAGPGLVAPINGHLPHPVLAAAAAYKMNPIQGGGESNMQSAVVSARNSNKRQQQLQQRLFININSNHMGTAIQGIGGVLMPGTTTTAGVINHQKRQPLIGSGIAINFPDSKTSGANGEGGGELRRKIVGAGSQSSSNPPAGASHTQVPLLVNGTSVDSRGNQSSSSNNGRGAGPGGVQVISRKFINFAGIQANQLQQQQQQPLQTTRAATHSQKRHMNLVGMLPLTQMKQNLLGNSIEQSPRDLAPSSGRSGRSGKSNGNESGLVDLLQSTRGGFKPLNGRLSQRKSQGAIKFNNNGGSTNAVSAPHHQLGYRRQQIMDITEDSNTNSKNNLAKLIANPSHHHYQNLNERGSGGGAETTINSHETEGNNPSSSQLVVASGNAVNSGNGGGPAYSLFYHSNSNNLQNSLAASSESLNRFNSKKSLGTGGQKNLQSKLEKTSPYSINSGGGSKEGKQFQFTRKQNLMNGDSSVSATREKGVKLLKIKKPQPVKVALNRDSQQQINAGAQTGVGSGKRRPLIIRKNNYVTNTGNGASNERGSQKDNSDLSPFNKTSNFNTLISGNGPGAGGINQGARLNNTSSFVGLSSEGSMSQTHTLANIKQSTQGISHLLKNLNATLPNEGEVHALTIKASFNQLTLKDAKLIKQNLSKKRLDTARKSRLHQIQVKEHPGTSGLQINSLFQQPTDSRQPNPLSLMTKKKRSLLIPKQTKQGNDGQSDTNNTLSSNGGGDNNGSLNNILINRPSERASRRDTLRQEDGGDGQMTNNNIGVKLISKSEERTISNDVSNSSQQPKVLSRGQIMRMMKQKQQQNSDSTSNQRNSCSDNQRSPNTIHHQIQSGVGLLPTNRRSLNHQKSSKSLRNNSESKKEKSIAMDTNSLPRVESKKDLQYIFSTNSQYPIGGNNLEKHLVKEELIILENINDSSGTPGDFKFLSKQIASQIAAGGTTSSNILHIEDEQNHLNQPAIGFQLNQPSMTDDQNYSKFEEERDSNSIPHDKPMQEVSNKQTKPQKREFSKSKMVGDKEPEVTIIPIVEEEVIKDTLNNHQQRLLNSSIAQVKSPIGTATSIKSQNSQQAGPNHDEIVKFPMRPGKALKLFLNQLTDFEKGEILDYQEIYYVGLTSQKIHGNPKEQYNYGYDDEKGDYKIVMKDHIGYRYEVMSFLGKGSFGTALKCFDHKLKEEVALKVVKNKKKYAYQAGIELKILNFLQENDPDDIMNVIHMRDYVIFRKHLCISFELLSMNLFEFLKINDFNGFDHNLIRRFAIQLLYALKYLKEFQIIHCDLKPENILLKEANKSGIKIIDFGSSTFLDERVYTYIQSRFYRAPEIMLGIPYTCAIDMWSFGCIMAELYIGYPIFPGESENDQMSRIIEMINIPQPHVYEISQRRGKFFTETPGGDYEPIMLKNSRDKLRKPGGKPLSLLLGDEDLDFLDFVKKCLEWDPDQRMSPDEALRHIWILKGLPPQVLVHHQRMHNIATPELPESVKVARDQFFLEMTLRNSNANNHAGVGVEAPPHTSGIAHNTSQLGGNNQSTVGAANNTSGLSSAGNCFLPQSATKNSQNQQQSLNNHPRSSHQTGGGAVGGGGQGTTIYAPSGKISIPNLPGGSKQTTNNSNIKAETIKSLERAQLKKQLRQINNNPKQLKLNPAAFGAAGGTGQLANVNLSSKLTTIASNPLVTLTDSHRRNNIGEEGHNMFNPPQYTTRKFQQNVTLNSGGSSGEKTGGVFRYLNPFEQTNPLQAEGSSSTGTGKVVVGFKRRNHMAAARHQRNHLNMVVAQGGADALTS